MKTCLKELHEHLSWETEAYADTTAFAGLMCLMMFFLHFCLYCQPAKTQDREEVPPNEFQGANIHQQAYDPPVESNARPGVEMQRLDTNEGEVEEKYEPVNNLEKQNVEF